MSAVSLAFFAFVIAGLAASFGVKKDPRKWTAQRVVSAICGYGILICAFWLAVDAL